MFYGYSSLLDMQGVGDSNSPFPTISEGRSGRFMANKPIKTAFLLLQKVILLLCDKRRKTKVQTTNKTTNIHKQQAKGKPAPSL